MSDFRNPDQYHGSAAQRFAARQQEMMQRLDVIERHKHEGGGSGGGGATALDELSDVTLSGPLDNQVLTYDTATGQWRNEASQGGAQTPQPIDWLTDVQITGTPLDWMVLRYSSGLGQWVNSVVYLDNLYDVNAPINTMAEGQVLTWDAATSNWVNRAPAAPAPQPINWLTDVTVTGTPTNGSVLKWQATQWVNSLILLDDVWDVNLGGGVTDGEVLTYNAAGGYWTADPVPQMAPQNLDWLVDVAITTPVYGHTLVFNGSTWVNAAPFAAVSPFQLVDPAGGSYPALRYLSGDGDGTNANPYFYEWNLNGDKMRLFSGRQPAKQVAAFYRPATDEAEFTLNETWTTRSKADGHLYWYQGTDRTTPELTLTSAGALLLAADPTTALGAATKQYVDAKTPIPQPLDWLTDVTIATPANGQALIYEAASSQWKNAALPTFAAQPLDWLTDVTIATPTDGQVLTYETASGLWKNKVAASGGGTPAAYYLFCQFNPVALAAGTFTAIPLNATPLEAAGFTVSGTKATCQQAGRYFVQVTHSGPPVANSQYMDTVITHGRGASTVVRNVSGVGAGGMGGWTSPVNAQGIVNLSVGDWIEVKVSSDLARTLDSRSWLTIVPVGGAKGDKGDPGASTGSSPFIIPDPVGAAYPALRFDSGDGANGTAPNPFFHEFNLYNDRLRLFSNRTPSRAIVDFGAPAANYSEVTIGGNWTLEDRNDGWLRFFYGTDRAAAEAAFGGGQGELVIGPLTCKGISTNARINATDIVCSAQYIYGAGAMIVSSNGVSYASLSGNSNGGQLLAGHQYGVGDYGKVCVVSNSANNSWQYRPLTITATGSAEAGFSYYQAAKGWAASMQMFWDGSYYIGILNGDNTGYIKCYASAFTVQSSARFKGDVTRLERGSVRDRIKRIKPVHYRDLQEDLARAVNTEPVKGYQWPEGHKPQRDEGARRAMREAPAHYRYGLIAEEVAEEFPDLVTPSHLGPGIDLSGLVAVLWQHVQELTEQVEALQSARPGGAA